MTPKYAPVMRTIDRSPGPNYLMDTLMRLNHAKLWDHRLPMTKLILCDSGSPNVMAYLQDLPSDPRFYCAVSPTRLTNNQNALRALRLGIETGAEWILHLEDDIDVCDRFLESIDGWLTDHAVVHPSDDHYLLYTFHAPYKGVRDAMNRGEASWKYPIDRFYGNQCWAMRRDDAIRAADYLEKTIPTWASGQGFDLLLKQWATEEGHTHFLASAPSFAQHIGKDSSLHPGRFHENASWPGRAWRYVSTGGQG